MEGADAVLALVSGVIIRFGIPVAITALAVWLLRLLDKRWQKDAEAKDLVKVRAKNPGCWNIKNCSEEKRAGCKAYQNSEFPCWQLLRDQEGRLRENCLGCDVFQGASIPVAI